MFGDFFIFQTAEDTVIAGRLIPKGYCNLTHILKAGSVETGKNKQWTKYFKTEGAQEFLEELANQNGFCVIENSVVRYCTTPQPQDLQPLLTLPRLKARGILSSLPYGFYQTTYSTGFLQLNRGRAVPEREFRRAPPYFFLISQVLSSEC